MREPQPSHVGRSGEHVGAHLSAPRLKRGRDPMSSATQTQEETLGTARDRLQGMTFCSFPTLGRSFVCFSDFVSASFFAPQRDTQVREAFPPAPWGEMGHIFPSHNPLLGLVLPPSCFANGCACPHLQYHHPQSCKTRVQGFLASIALCPVQLLVAGGAQRLASHGIWLLL